MNTAALHHTDCEWHHDQYDRECTCGAVKNLPASQVREDNGARTDMSVWKHWRDAIYPFATLADDMDKQDEDRMPGFLRDGNAQTYITIPASRLRALRVVFEEMEHPEVAVINAVKTYAACSKAFNLIDNYLGDTDPRDSDHPLLLACQALADVLADLASPGEPFANPSS
jgi:hypothetical protein